MLPDNLVESLASDLEGLVIHSAPASSWSKHTSAWNIFFRFCKENCIPEIWPTNTKTIRAFAVWAVSRKNLKPSTIKSYISSIALGHDLSGLPHDDFSKDKILHLILKGANNNSIHYNANCDNKISVNPSMLCVLGHRISTSEGDAIFKQAVWTACLVSFFSSCRMGEILTCNATSFDPGTNVTWENLKFTKEGEIVIYLPYTKTMGFKGDFIDLFPFPKKNYCPVENLHKLRKMLKAAGFFNPSYPIFMISKGFLLTQNKLNELLGFLMSDFCENQNVKITCHSFRASLPSLIESLAEKGFSKDVKEWGRWSSSAYVSYTKNVRERKRLVFNKIIEVLINLLK